MATIGLRRPYYAKYNFNEQSNEVTYSGGGVLAKAVDFSSNINTADNNSLYADDAIAETDTFFSGGTIDVTADDLPDDVSIDIFGLQENSITVDGAPVQERVYDEDQVVPDLGFGIIIVKSKRGVTRYRAIVFTKIKFNLPSDEAVTRGERTEWQTMKLTAIVMRDDTPKHAWKREATFTDEAKARKYIESILNIGIPEA